MPNMDIARSEHLPQGPVVDVDWLADHLDDVVVVDASIMGERGAATGIPGARRFDLDGPLSDQDAGIPHTMLGAEGVVRATEGPAAVQVALQLRVAFTFIVRDAAE